MLLALCQLMQTRSIIIRSVALMGNWRAQDPILQNILSSLVNMHEFSISDEIVRTVLRYGRKKWREKSSFYPIGDR